MWFFHPFPESCPEQTEKTDTKEQARSCVTVEYKDIHMVSSFLYSCSKDQLVFQVFECQGKLQRHFIHCKILDHAFSRFLALRNTQVETLNRLP